MSPSNLALVCSSGGHLFELLSLKALWAQRPHFWVTFDTADARSLLAGEDVVWAYHPTNRNILNLWRNWRLAQRVMAERRPTLALSTGAGVAVPFLLAARKQGAHTIYVESITRLHELSLSGRMLYRRVDEFLVQWPELAAKLSDARYEGRIL
jgi:beta-1,4-N-acetylglucosaminyltransferase